ncbi:hypothetical protein P3576_01325 [Vibrio parahaemolyticus]|uniref:hypothetical protein n=1 Tax=Vibrio antiquarius (strain Ex25) TaxID=150340 RepID=UPI0023EBCFB6|nr:hypothetical protein [Vibrio antiquarius]EHK1074261.1 hypothetical protein [Vibrio parahaemolyticus]MCR9628893.1 hypothetical protein [Vibrio antiquarius]MCR9632926.1 hypothetical protein [Vibrio antiquarius]MDF4881891.1 hypothetical protein [Vibrio parahaemolyticus]MDF4899250.1 hypothetical protein [Vibrio parahaemolyticus]
MNYGDIFKSFTTYIYERATSPFLWIFFACFAFGHWNDILVLFLSEDDVYKKISYIEKSISEASILGLDPHAFFYVLGPLLSAMLISIAYPILSIVASACYDFSLYVRNLIAQFFDSKQFLSQKDSLELKNERFELLETFTKQLQENQKQLRETQQQFMYSQSNCAALFCTLGFSKGQESLLPYSDLFGSFLAKTPEQRDIILALNELSPNQGPSKRLTVSGLTNEIKQLDCMPSLKHLSQDDVTKIVEELVVSGAITPTYTRTGGGRDQISLNTVVTLTPNGRKFSSSINYLRNGSFKQAMDYQSHH